MRKHIYIFKKKTVINRNAWMRDKEVEQRDKDRKSISDDEAAKMMARIRTAHEENLAGAEIDEATDACMNMANAPGKNR